MYGDIAFFTHTIIEYINHIFKKLLEVLLMKIIASEFSTYNEAIHELVELRDILKTEYVQKGKTHAEVDWIGKQIVRILNGLNIAVSKVDEKFEFIQDHTDHFYGW